MSVKTLISEKIRLHKHLALLGISSRREAEKWISEGRVRIDNVQAKLGDLVDPKTSNIIIDGRPINKVSHSPKLYFAINKPDLMLTSRKSQNNMDTIYDLKALKKLPFKLDPVGRLDFRTEGLLILTNDGDLAFKLMHPKYKVNRTYKLITQKTINIKKLKTIRESGGIQLEDDWVAFKIKHTKAKNLGASFGAQYKVSLQEGRNRIVRKIFDKLEAPVIKLKRVDYGPISLGPMKKGEARQLTKREVFNLKSSVKVLLG